MASTFDFAIKQHKKGTLKRIVVVSSSMVFETTEIYPTPESEVDKCTPPLSTYGFQKLACEYFAKGAYEQYGVPYTIIRPFNCVGIGEEEAIGDDKPVIIGNMKMMLSHVLPDIINKALIVGPDGELPILGTGEQVRHYTNGKDIATGIIMAMESEDGLNNDFNISHPDPWTVNDLAEEVWYQLYGNRDIKFKYEEPYEYDVQYRSPDVSKAKEVLSFEAKVEVKDSIKEVIEWVKNKK